MYLPPKGSVVEVNWLVPGVEGMVGRWAPGGGFLAVSPIMPISVALTPSQWLQPYQSWLKGAMGKAYLPSDEKRISEACGGGEFWPLHSAGGWPGGPDCRVNGAKKAEW